MHEIGALNGGDEIWTAEPCAHFKYTYVFTQENTVDLCINASIDVKQNSVCISYNFAVILEKLLSNKSMSTKVHNNISTICSGAATHCCCI